MFRVENTLWWYTGMRRVVAAFLNGTAGTRGWSLDAGCGTGGNLPSLARYGTVVGLDFSEDKMLVGRTFSYSDTQRYRVGTNYLQLPVNQPK